MKRKGKEYAREMFISVQLLSPEPCGRTQKYTRIGALESVQLEEQTLPGIKASCLNHYNQTKACDVLMSERGPSVRNVSQVNLKKVVHIRFIDDEVKIQDPEKINSNQLTPPPPSSSLPLSTGAPPSVSMSKFLKAGQLIPPKKIVVELAVEMFDIKELCWKDPEMAKFVIDKEEFARGGFRKVFKAKCFSGDLERGTYVVKVPLDMEQNEETLNGDTNDQTRKTVQMHMLARHLAACLAFEAPKEFGKCFEYEKVYYTVFDGKGASIEKFIEGTFVKYINNNGEFVDGIAGELMEKAQAFMHYSYKKTNEEIMITDIQGFNFILTDPEIASKDVCNRENRWNFCLGNCSLIAITNFFSEHVCNKYCEILKL